MLKCIGETAAASVRDPSGTSCMRMATSPARASEGTTSAASAAMVTASFCMTNGAASNSAASSLRAQGPQPSCAYNPYSVKRLLIAVFLLALILPAGPAAAARSKVLAIHFNAEVNPVTQDWLNNELSFAQSHGYSAAVIVLDTPGG